MLNIAAHKNNFTEGRGLVDNDNYLTVVGSGYQRFITKDWSVIREKGRPDYQIIYIIKGRGFFTFNEQTYEVPEGSIAIYTPGLPQYYNYYCRDCTEVCWVHFTGNGVHRLLESMNLLDSNIYHIGYGKEFVELFNEITHELQVKRPRFEELSSALLLSLLGKIARVMDESKIRKINTTFEKIFKMMHSNFNRNQQIRDYAKECNLSVYWFIHKFKELTGFSPTAYIKQLRINEAKYLLSNFSLSISEVSFMVGYENPLYFSRVFKQETGISPRDYRKTLLL
ncbi:MAG: AraC family transcriptional regulator [Firmicutes bacterium]|nr:AraC family transcriptional regulator [Bacillota bacterium]